MLVRNGSHDRTVRIDGESACENGFALVALPSHMSWRFHPNCARARLRCYGQTENEGKVESCISQVLGSLHAYTRMEIIFQIHNLF